MLEALEPCQGGKPMRTLLLTITAGTCITLAACTPDREGEMGRVDPAAVPPGDATVTVDAAERERQLRDALAACEDVTPALSREQCETEARRAYEGTTGRQPYQR
jgi:hypothetical protein